MDINKRVYGLDIMRCIAILSVVIGHFFNLYVNAIYTRWADALTIDGVTIFFVLSGYLIGKILINMHESDRFEYRDLHHFWIRRWLRTLPAYFVCLIIILSIYFLYDNYSVIEALKYFVFIQNISGFPKFFLESWSLCVEEWFYLIIPVAIYFTAKWKYAVIFWICFVILFVTIFRTIATENITSLKDWHYNIKGVLLYRMDSLMFGVLTAYLIKKKIYLPKKVLFILGIIMLIAFQIDIAYNELSFFRKYFYLSFGPLAAALAIPWLIELKNGKGIFYNSVTFISLISYSIYLVHLTLFYYIGEVLLRKTGYHNKISLGISYFIWAFVVGYLLYKIIELPFMRWRDRITSNTKVVQSV